MAISPDNLIEKFASMLEEGESLGADTFADKAIEIIAMISVEPALNETLNRINATLHTIISSGSDFKFDALEMGSNAKACAANKIRALKHSARPEALH